jgi:hypothetical protein
MTASNVSSSSPSIEHGALESNEFGGGGPSPASSQNCLPLISPGTWYRSDPRSVQMSLPSEKGNSELSERQSISQVPQPILQSHSEALSPVLPFSRPTSVPQVTSGATHEGDYTDTLWSDRTSSASLPVPMHTPYSMLPTLQDQDWHRNRPTRESFVMDSLISVFPPGSAKSRLMIMTFQQTEYPMTSRMPPGFPARRARFSRTHPQLHLQFSRHPHLHLRMARKETHGLARRMSRF